jgi:hypothetical protein
MPEVWPWAVISASALCPRGTHHEHQTPPSKGIIRYKMQIRIILMFKGIILKT